MDDVFDEDRMRALAHSLLLIHGPADLRTLRLMMYLCDADHYELYEDEIVFTPYVMTADGPEPLGFGRICDGIMAGDHHAGYLTMFHPQELDVIRRVARLVTEMGDAAFARYVFSDTPLMIAEPGEVIDMGAVFYRDSEHSVSTDRDNGP